MAYFKTNLRGQLAVTPGTTGAGTAASMPNFGTSYVANSSGEAFVLEAPVAGCKKRVVFTHLTSANLSVLRSCTAGGDNISFLGATTGINTITLTTVRAGFVTVIDLEGQNSTSWIVTNIYPDTSVGVVAYSSA